MHRDVGKGRIALSCAFVVALVAATVPWWVNGDWPMLHEGGSQLLRASALHTYVDVSGLQAGPPALFVIGLITLTGAWATTILHVLLWLIGAAILLLAGRTAWASDSRAHAVTSVDDVTVQWTSVLLVATLPFLAYVLSRSLLQPVLGTAFVIAVLGLVWLRHRSADGVTGSLTMPRPLWLALLAVGPWSTLASGWVHLDDGLAMLAMAVALHQRALGRRWSVALAVGAAIAFKPWAIAALPLVLRPGPRKAVCRELAVAMLIPALCWLPFVLAASGTLGAASHAFLLDPNSTVHWLGLHDHFAPPWLRTAQLAMILLCAFLGSRRGPAEALAAGLIARLIFDPGIINYYTAGAVVFIAIADLIRQRPAWRTGLAIVGLWLSPFFVGGALSTVRAVTLGLLLAAETLPVFAALDLSQSRTRGVLFRRREIGRAQFLSNQVEVVGDLPTAPSEAGKVGVDRLHIVAGSGDLFGLHGG
jgi:hypothetical protein